MWTRQDSLVLSVLALWTSYYWCHYPWHQSSRLLFSVAVVCAGLCVHERNNKLMWVAGNTCYHSLSCHYSLTFTSHLDYWQMFQNCLEQNVRINCEFWRLNLCRLCSGCVQCMKPYWSRRLLFSVASVSPSVSQSVCLVHWEYAKLPINN